MNKKKPYIICAPGYQKSNGCRVLHNLALEIEKRGYEAYLYSLYPRNERFKYIDNLDLVDKNSAIIVYPEITSGNPLRFKNVVRLVLYYPGILGGTKEYFDEELIFVHDRIFSDKGDVLTVPFIDTSLFYSDDTPKNKVCYFINKGGKWRDVPELVDAIEINMSYPENRDDLAKLLRETKVFYSYDDCSAIMDEALMCGCEVKIIKENGFEYYKPDYLERIQNFEEQIQNFIVKTQAMNAQSIEKVRPLRFKPILFYNYLKYKYILKDKEKAQLCWWRIKNIIH